ncbi:MAG: restriction endonuclease subunit S [Chloroflexi bacterium]|nr:restriction endonuclease subunit S [Chloroflexota bacterium]
MSWDTIPLGEFLTLKRGYDLPSTQRQEGIVPVVSSSGITGFHNEAKVEGPGVVTGRYGTLGEVFFIQEDFWPLNTALYVQDFKGNDRRFTAYFLKSILKGTSSDKAAVPGVNRNDLHVLMITVTMDSREQREIASILSAYDDLIENNRRRIQLLEQAARLLYKEWFVHLRFPGHEHVKITDSVPDGWEKKTAFDVMEVLSGGTPKTNVSHYWDGGIPFYTPKDSTGYAYIFKTEKTLTEEGLRNCNSQLYPKDTIFITARGTVGKINLAQIDMAMNQRDTFKLIPFVVPDDKVIRTFTDYASPLLRQIDLLSSQTRKLAEARYLLLPRLMSGEVAV